MSMPMLISKCVNAMLAAVLLIAAGDAAGAKEDKAAAQVKADVAKAVTDGNLAAIRVAWTIWQDRNMSQTVEIKKGRFIRYGGVQKNERVERDLKPEEKKALLAALADARVDKLIWINRDVKNQFDRVLNIDLVKPDGSLQPMNAFVRTKFIWDHPPTDKLAALLERWLSPDVPR